MSKTPGPIMIAAGGTGGHVYPGLAVARALMARDIPVVWMGTHRGLESRVIPEAGIPMAWLDVSGVRGKGLITLLLAPFKLVRTFIQSIKIMLKHKPAMVLGMGGFVAGPGGLTAALMGKPLVIHEQNAIAGLTNKWLSRFACKILTGFPQTFASLPKTEFVGNPVRADIKSVSTLNADSQHTNDNLKILVFGGSLGAKALNETVPHALKQLSSQSNIAVRHQTGKGKDDSTRALYQSLNFNLDDVESVDVIPFIDDMASAYAWADVVVCRAGALTVAELTAAGVASILIPYPYAVDDHQTANARFITDNGAGILMSESELTAEALSAELELLLKDRQSLQVMSNKSLALAKPDATQRVTDICANLAGYLAQKEGSHEAA